QLLAEAGYPNGFDAGHVTPLPNYFSLGERVISSLRQIGIEAQLNQMERGAFFAKLGQPGAFPPGMVINISGAPGDAAARIRSFALCPPQGASSQICDPTIDEMFARYEASTDGQEREQISAEIQRYILDNFIFVPIYRQAFINVKGPRIANPWQEIIGAIPQYVYVGPYEDIRLKE
ncbi:MAG TPA: hypothetical protein VHL09_03570, partial [Dehalococcoidia bacterium]|nr:hypothetical protein [Dehalococcoidia bacterium]